MSARDHNQAWVNSIKPLKKTNKKKSKKKPPQKTPNQTQKNPTKKTTKPWPSILVEI